MSKQETLAYAKVIINQIQKADPTAMMCGGVSPGHTLFALPETKERRAGIKMICNGHIHKGRVDVDLAWSDTYTIKFFDKDDEENPAYVLRDVYATELCRLLDIHIESGEESPVKDLEVVLSSPADGVLVADVAKPMEKTNE